MGISQDEKNWRWVNNPNLNNTQGNVPLRGNITKVRKSLKNDSAKNQPGFPGGQSPDVYGQELTWESWAAETPWSEVKVSEAWGSGWSSWASATEPERGQLWAHRRESCANVSQLPVASELRGYGFQEAERGRSVWDTCSVTEECDCPWVGDLWLTTTWKLLRIGSKWDSQRWKNKDDFKNEIATK